MAELLQNLRYAQRVLRKSPAFSLVAIAVLAIGIGANSAIFSVIYAVLLRPLPYVHPERLVDLRETESAPGDFPLTFPDFQDWKTQNHVFDDMALYSWGQDANLSGTGEPESVAGLFTEANFFSVLGAQPILGRSFAAGEDQPGKNHVAVLSYQLWMSHYGGDPRLVGRDIRVNSENYTVIGIMPREFHFSGDTDLWLPFDLSPKKMGERGSHSYRGVARLKPQVTLAQARAEMSTISKRLEHQYPASNTAVAAILTPLRDRLVGDSRPTLLLLLSAVVFVLLIACANVANLLLSRAFGRMREVALRTALGATRGRVLRQLLTESVLLALIGGVAGVALALAAVSALVTGRVFDLPRYVSVEISLPVLAFTFALAVATGIVFGMAPALHISRPDVVEELKAGSGTAAGAGRHRRRLTDALAVAEIAISLLLLIEAGLLIKSFARLRSVDVGVRAANVFTAQLSLPDTHYHKDAQVVRFFDQLLPRVRALPGVDSAAVTWQLPLEGGSNGYVVIEGKPKDPTGGPLVESTPISSDYFRTMGIPLLEGRVIDDADNRRALAVTQDFDYQNATPAQFAQMRQWVFPVVINRTMARRFWPGENAVGKFFRWDFDNSFRMQVVGVVGDVRQWGLHHEPVPQTYSTLGMAGRSNMALVVHSAVPPLSLANQIRRAVRQVDSDLPVTRVRTMEQVIASAASDARAQTMLLGIFSAVAILLAVAGIYGVMSYMVTQRTREIGLRVALGAARGDVLRLILKHGAALAGLGVGSAVVGALATARLTATFLYQVSPFDAGIIVSTALLVAGVALLASYLPARRASRVQPMAALRYE